MRWSTGPEPCPSTPPSLRANSTRRQSPSTAVRNAASACGFTETGRSWAGLAGLGWAGGDWAARDRVARAPSKLSIGLALFDPDHRAVSCTPSRTRPRTGSQAQRDSMLLALLLLQTGQSCPTSSERPTALPVRAAPPPRAHVLCRTLRCERLMVSTPCCPDCSILVASSSLWL